MIVTVKLLINIYHLYERLFESVNVFLSFSPLVFKDSKIKIWSSFGDGGSLSHSLSFLKYYGQRKAFFVYTGLNILLL